MGKVISKYDGNSNNNNNNDNDDDNLVVSKRTLSTKTPSPRSSTSDRSCISNSSSNCDSFVGAAKLYYSDDASRYDECDRMQIQHFLVRDAWESNFSSPMEDMLERGRTRCLDVGCSSGAWVLEMASTYSDSKFYGVEILPLFPTFIKPSNAKFAVANVVEGLPFDDDVFDFVHMGFMGMSLAESSWKRVVEELVRVTKSGGWIEICDTDNLWINAGPKAKRFRSKVSKELFAGHGIKTESSSIVNYLFLNNHLLTNFNHEEKYIPLGSWGGKLGNMYLENLRWGVKNMRKIVNSLGLSDEKYDHRVNSFIREIELKGNVCDVSHRFWARKL